MLRRNILRVQIFTKRSHSLLLASALPSWQGFSKRHFINHQLNGGKQRYLLNENSLFKIWKEFISGNEAVSSFLCVLQYAVKVSHSDCCANYTKVTCQMYLQVLQTKVIFYWGRKNLRVRCKRVARFLKLWLGWPLEFLPWKEKEKKPKLIWQSHKQAFIISRFGEILPLCKILWQFLNLLGIFSLIYAHWAK